MNELIMQTNNRADMTFTSASEETKEIAEIQGKMFLARKFPRDVDYAVSMIKKECTNKNIAEQALYEFPRGDSVVRGPSIRLIECVARYWGNIVSGVKELGVSGNTATVKAYCWDLQTNFFDEKVFDVELVRSTKKGTYPLTDPRDRYEMIANQGARRKRACMQAIIPQFVIDEAIAECQNTLERDVNEHNIEETKAKMLTAFEKIADWITEEHLAQVCGKDFDKLGAKDIVKLRNLYNAIKDGFIKPEKAFGREGEPEKPSFEEKETLSQLNDMLGGAPENAQTNIG